MLVQVPREVPLHCAPGIPPILMLFRGMKQTRRLILRCRTGLTFMHKALEVEYVPQPSFQLLH